MFYSLQIGRALAALAVVFHHSCLSAQHYVHTLPSWLVPLQEEGKKGIDYFFVLSGFVIMHATRNMLANSRADLAKYTQARLVRIFVPYLPIGAAILLLLLLLPQLSGRGGDDVGIFSSLLLMRLDGKPALSVAWTLQHELVFYLLFGICLFVLRTRTSIFLWAVPIALASGYTLTYAQQLWLSQYNLEFLAGAAAYMLYASGRAQGWGAPLVALGGALLAAYYALDAPYLFIGISFAMIVLGLVLLEKRIDFARVKSLTFLGAASYSVYLVHDPALSVLARIARATNAPEAWPALMFAMIILATLAGVAYHLIIEKPAIRWVKRRLASLTS